MVIEELPIGANGNQAVVKRAAARALSHTFTDTDDEGGCG
jgi:hypothetical protein